MKKTILAVTILTLILCGSCSSDDSDRVSPQFTFFEFDKDVLLPALNEREISFYALDFDENIGNWELTLSDGQKDIPVTLSKVETTTFGWVTTESRLQKIYFKAPAFGGGDYTLTIKNTTTNQTYSDVFLVRSTTFNKVLPGAVDVLYTGSNTSYTIAGSREAEDYLFFQNSTNTISEGITTNGIQKVLLEKKDNSESFSLEYNLDSNDNLSFTIPPSIQVGNYFLSVHYTNGLSTYFIKDIVVMDQQTPVIASANKETFSSEETLIIKGQNFRYKINHDLLTTKGISNPQSPTYLVFKDANREHTVSFGRYSGDEFFDNINTDGTELSYKIPVKSEAYIFTDREATYFEGEMYIQTAYHKSEAVPVRIDYQ
ncbi:hypothetical protein [Aquimarina aquimarini]|uniref:hypothetical protein n=1 Tax=Aquimarina aquimarini TaxID=1191734 RepID=UPI000D5607A8|nr:hypothetical protein [Aquimarina aquimarini]